MKLTARICLLWAIVMNVGVAAGAQDLSPFFKDTEGAFVLFDLKSNHYIRYNEQRCRQRFSPHSTFKIPNTLIGLETGIISNADFFIAWDRRKYPPRSTWTSAPFIHWKRDHTLQSALKYSVLWYYREIAQRIGEQKMKRFVTEFDYGNRDISGGLSSPNLFEAFWLRSTLKISADEQIEFLKRLYLGRLPVSKRSIDIVKSILVLEETPTYKLSGKTGGGPAGNGNTLGWFVGYLETKGNVYLFATNIEGATYADIRDKRIDITRRILTELGHLPKQK